MKLLVWCFIPAAKKDMPSTSSRLDRIDPRQLACNNNNINYYYYYIIICSAPAVGSIQNHKLTIISSNNKKHGTSSICSGSTSFCSGSTKARSNTVCRRSPAHSHRLSSLAHSLPRHRRRSPCPPPPFPRLSSLACSHPPSLCLASLPTPPPPPPPPPPPRRRSPARPSAGPCPAR